MRYQTYDEYHNNLIGYIKRLCIREFGRITRIKMKIPSQRKNMITEQEKNI